MNDNNGITDMTMVKKKTWYNSGMVDFYGTNELEPINDVFAIEWVLGKLKAADTKKILEDIETELVARAEEVDKVADEVKPKRETKYANLMRQLIQDAKQESAPIIRGNSVRWFEAAETISLAKLSETTLPPIDWLVEDFMVVGGAAMLTAKPKMGKTFMALQLGISVANGVPFLNFPTRAAGVLYIAHEDGLRSFQNRISMMTENPPENFYVMTNDTVEIGTIGNGFERQVEYQLKLHPEIKLVINDTYQHIQADRTNKKSAYSQDYSEISGLNKWAKKHGITLLLVHHNRKGEGNADYYNPLDSILGSMGLAGGAQALYIITKQDNEVDEAKLTISGKDIPEKNIFITHQSETNRTWVRTEPEVILSRQQTISQSPIMTAIFDSMQTMKPDDVIKVTNKELTDRANELSAKDNKEITSKEIGLWIAKYMDDIKTYFGIIVEKERDNKATYYNLSQE